MPVKLCIVIPTYNEKDNVKDIINSVSAVLGNNHWEIIFVDDDSPDGTSDLVREIASQNEHIRCIQRIKRRGLASACIEGIMASISPYVAVMDADLQHDEKILPAMLQQLELGNADLVIGSRYMDGGSTGTLSEFRTWISKSATRFSRLVIKDHITDPMSGFFMMKRTTFMHVVRHLSGKGFKILLDILVACDPEVRVTEIPYQMKGRIHGESKLDATVIWEFFTLIFYKLAGQLIPYRFLSFALVGLSGVFVQVGFLGLFYRILQTGFLQAQIGATVLAMTSNFVLNNYLTFRQTRLKGRQIFTGLLSFYLACSIGAIMNVAMADFLYEQSVHWWIASSFGAVTAAVWNYATTATFTWGPKEGKPEN